MQKVWTTSVNELMDIFRESMSAIIPWVEKARISWKGDESYDEWENIADALFSNIVCSSLYGEVSSEYPIARYGYDYKDYESLDYIQLVEGGSEGQKFIFKSFETKSSPFDSIAAVELDKKDHVTRIVTIPNKNLIFSLVKRISGQIEIVRNLVVKL